LPTCGAGVDTDVEMHPKFSARPCAPGGVQRIERTADLRRRPGGMVGMRGIIERRVEERRRSRRSAGRACRRVGDDQAIRRGSFLRRPASGRHRGEIAPGSRMWIETTAARAGRPRRDEVGRPAGASIAAGGANDRRPRARSRCRSSTARKTPHRGDGDHREGDCQIEEEAERAAAFDGGDASR
jgi:hypothetical protein